MKLVELKFKLTKNLGNYESASLEATAQLAETDSSEQCFLTLKSYVEEALAGELGKSVAITKVTKEPLKEETVETKNNEVKKTATKKVAKKVAKKVVKRAKAPVKYDRTNTAHKDEFADLLNDLCSGWKDSKESKMLAKACSEKLNGTPMFDGDSGSMLGTFTDVVIELMTPASDDL